jgi:DNA polymerase-1
MNKEKLVVIRTLEQLKELQSYIDHAEYIAVDTETTSVNKDAQIIGFSISADVDTGYYVILREWNRATQTLDDLHLDQLAETILKSLINKKLIMHNAIFDCWKIEMNFGIKLIDHVFCDTMLLAHLIDENRRVGLKDLGAELFGVGAKEEQQIMHDSVIANGGKLTRADYELYKADSELIGRYGAKDTVLTLSLFYHMIPQLIEQGLDTFFFEETMPLLRGPTYDLNTTGLKVDKDKLQQLRGTLEAENMELTAFIYREIDPHVKSKYPGTNKKNLFNINSNNQLSWLLFEILGQYFNTLTDGGKEVCQFLGLKLPYDNQAKREFIRVTKLNLGKPYKTNVKGKPTLIKEWWTYTSCNIESLKPYESKYKWVQSFRKLNKNNKILQTYVIGIQDRLNYGIVYPSFLQHGTTSGRYSSRNPNLQNLPRDDKRVKACIIARPGNVLVGADYSQLEPRVFASFSKDELLLKSFDGSSDFYSTIGIEIFGKYDATPQKDGSPDAFGVKYKKLRDIAKVVALSATYGTTAPKMAKAVGKSREEAQEIIDDYFNHFPKVKTFMLESHELAKNNGEVVNLFGRPRRMPEATLIKKLFNQVLHEKLDYKYRNILNLAVNHRIQSTGASIMNRSSIAVYKAIKRCLGVDPRWSQVKILLQVHDELVLEGPEELGEEMSFILKHCMENTVQLPGVKLEALPKIAKNLADLK